MDFTDYKFRASLSYVLTVGNIGLSETEKNRIDELELRKTTKLELTDGQQKKYNDYSTRESLTEPQKTELKKLDDKKNSFLGLTETMEEELKNLYIKKADNSLPKTMLTELRKIWRSEKYDRRFLFTNKYIKKGLDQEEESFSVYQKWLEAVKNEKFLLLNNKKRLTNDFFTGETDCDEHFYNHFGYGFDIKTSWSIETFPFKEDELDLRYYWQNMVYMYLTGITKWKTSYVLVNSTESTLHNEKMKYFYAYDLDKSERNQKKYDEVCRDLEKLHIVDYDRFVFIYPGHDLLIGRDEWFGNDWDIPLEDRVIEKTVLYDEEKIKEIIERVKIAREHLSNM